MNADMVVVVTTKHWNCALRVKNGSWSSTDTGRLTVYNAGGHVCAEFAPGVWESVQMEEAS